MSETEGFFLHDDNAGGDHPPPSSEEELKSLTPEQLRRLGLTSEIEETESEGESEGENDPDVTFAP